MALYQVGVSRAVYIYRRDNECVVELDFPFVIIYLYGGV
jgi:hypothetical protein